jgi:hypothetical protein
VADNFPPRPSPEQAADFRRRKRGTNLALLIVLLGVAALFFAITVSKMAGH